MTALFKPRDIGVVCYLAADDHSYGCRADKGSILEGPVCQGKNFGFCFHCDEEPLEDSERQSGFRGTWAAAGSQ